MGKSLDQKLEVGNTRATSNPKFRAWCFTSFKKDRPDPSDYTYYIIGLETCPTTGKQHWQGYIKFKGAVRFNTAKERIGDPEAHIEYAKGNDQQNIDYCSKEGDYIEDGKRPSQGERTDLLGVCKEIKENKLSAREVRELHPAYWCRNYRGLQDIVNDNIPDRDFITKAICIWGSPGVGKTTWARNKYPDAYVKDNSEWWDGYANQETVIWDDFDPDQCKLKFWLRLCDKLPMSVPIKGGHIKFTSKKIIFTTVEKYDDWWGLNDQSDENSFITNKNNKWDPKQISRRISKCIHLTRKLDLAVLKPKELTIDITPIGLPTAIETQSSPTGETGSKTA